MTDDGLNHVRVKRAFSSDKENPARPAVLAASSGSSIDVTYLDDGRTEQLVVSDSERLTVILNRPDLCRLKGNPLLLVNSHHRVLGVATGPTEPPSRLQVTIVTRLEAGAAVELVTDRDGQPSWQLLTLDPA